MSASTHQNQHVRGFTLVETLVAITLLMLVMVAFMTLARVGLTMSLFSKDRVSAYYLAQDAMQYMVNVHHNDVRTNGSDFDRILSQCASPGCTIDTVVDSADGSHIQACVGGFGLGSACPEIRYDAATRSYGYGAGEPSIFRRTVVVEPFAGSAIELSAVVTVSWIEEGGAPRTIELRRHFYSLKDFLTP